MRSAAVALAWVSVGAACIGFFQPWVRLDVRDRGLAASVKELASTAGAIPGLSKGAGRVTATIRRGTKTVSGDLSSLGRIPHEISGFQVPQLAHQENAQLALAIMELLTNEHQDIGLKSYTVYLLPGIALLCGILLTGLGGRPAAAWAIADVCAAIAAAGFWKLLTTDLRTLLVAIRIAQGLWLSLWAYVGLAIAGALTGLSLTRARA